MLCFLDLIFYLDISKRHLSDTLCRPRKKKACARLEESTVLAYHPNIFMICCSTVQLFRPGSPNWDAGAGHRTGVPSFCEDDMKPSETSPLHPSTMVLLAIWSDKNDWHFLLFDLMNHSF